MNVHNMCVHNVNARVHAHVCECARVCANTHDVCVHASKCVQACTACVCVPLRACVCANVCSMCERTKACVQTCTACVCTSVYVETCTRVCSGHNVRTCVHAKRMCRSVCTCAQACGCAQACACAPMHRCCAGPGKRCLWDGAPLRPVPPRRREVL